MISARLNVSDVKSVPFGKLSALYNNLTPPIVLGDKRSKTEKSSSIVSYVYAGLVAHPSIRLAILSDFSEEARKLALQQYEKEKNHFLIQRAYLALEKKYNESAEMKKRLLQTGIRQIEYHSELAVFSDNNVIGKKIMRIRDNLRRVELDHAQERENKEERIRKMRLYNVFNALKDLHREGNDLSEYLYQSFDEIASKLGIREQDVETSRIALPENLEKVLRNYPAHSAILATLIRSKNKSDRANQILHENMMLVRNAYIDDILRKKGVKQGDLIEQRDKYISENISKMPADFSSRLYFLWKKGTFVIPNDVKRLIKDIPDIPDREISYEEVAESFERDILDHFKDDVDMDDKTSRYASLTKLMNDMKDNKKDKKDVTMDDIHNMSGKDEKIVIHEADNRDSHHAHSMTSKNNLEYTPMQSVVYAGMREMNIPLRQILEFLKRDSYIERYFRLLEDNKERIVESRLVKALESVYNTENSEVGDKMPRLLVATGNSKLVYEDDDEFFSKLFQEKLGEIRTSLREKGVQPLPADELPQKPVVAEMKDFTQDKPTKVWVLSQIDDILYGLKAFRDYLDVRVLSDRHVDCIMKLYTNEGLIDRMADDLDVANDNIPADFINHIKKYNRGARVFNMKYTSQRLWDHAVLLLTMFNNLKKTLKKPVDFSTFEKLSKLSKLSENISAEDIDNTDIDAVVLNFKKNTGHLRAPRDVNDDYKKNHIANAAMSIIANIKKCNSLPTSWDRSDFLFAFSILSTQKKLDVNPISRDESDFPYIQDFLLKKLKGPRRESFEHIAIMFAVLLETLVKEEGVLSRVMFFSKNSKMEEMKEMKEEGDDEGDVKDEDDEGQEDNRNDIERAKESYNEWKRKFREENDSDGEDKEEGDDKEDKEEGDGDDGEDGEGADYDEVFDDDE
jgi:hypothetical protein